jgi:hypothetical protein
MPSIGRPLEEEEEEDRFFRTFAKCGTLELTVTLSEPNMLVYIQHIFWANLKYAHVYVACSLS